MQIILLLLLLLLLLGSDTEVIDVRVYHQLNSRSLPITTSFLLLLAKVIRELLVLLH